MSDEHARAADTRSYLVRCRAVAQDGEIRAYVRDLRSGEEHWVSEPSQLLELLTRSSVSRRRASDEDVTVTSAG